MGRLRNPLLVYIGFAIFFIAGMFMLFMGFKSLADGFGYKKTTATVISVRTYRNDEGEMLGIPTYEYYVDGERYEKERSYSQSVSICPLVGDTITVRYKKDDPSKVKDDSILTVMFFIFGVVFAGVGGTMFTLTAMGRIHWEPSHRRRYRHIHVNEYEDAEDSEPLKNKSNDKKSDKDKIDPFE